MSSRLVIALVLLMPLTLAARCGGSGSGGGTSQTWYVATDGNDGNTGTSIAAPFATFAKANSQVIPGDTVLIRGGSYTQTLEPTISGTAGNPITWAAYLGEPVVISNPPVPPSGTKRCIWLRLVSHITVDGISCDGQVAPPSANVDFGVMVQRSSHTIVANGTFRNINKRGVDIFHADSSYNRILDNFFEQIGAKGTFIGRSIAVAQGAHHNLVEGNSGNFAGHNHILIEDSAFNIIRNNHFENDWWRIAAITGATSVRNVFEGNELIGTAFDTGVANLPPGALEMRAPENILRRNRFADNLTDGIRLGAQPQDLRMDQNRLYHNTFYRNGSAAFRMTIENAPTALANDNVLVNNIMVESGYLHPLEQDSDGFQIDLNLTANGCPNPPELCFDGTLFINNSIRDDVNFEAVIKVDGILQADLTTYQVQYPQYFINNFGTKPPKFVDEATYDFTLQPSSQMIDLGTYLTEVTAPGYGSVIPVSDASYFMDGHGLVAGDRIQLENSTNPVMICAVDYDQNLLWVDGFLNWSVGQGVALAYEGASPDLGAFEFGAPTGSPGDPCTVGSGNGSCGLGFELALLLPLLSAGRRRRHLR